MPGRYTHVTIGVVCSICISVFHCNAYSIPFLYIVAFSFFGVAGAGLASLLPDIIEPAGNYNHRGFFHGKRMWKFLGICMAICLALFFIYVISSPFTSFESMLSAKRNESGWFYLFWVWFVFSACLGYFMHLTADSLTHMGLPD